MISPLYIPNMNHSYLCVVGRSEEPIVDVREYEGESAILEIEDAWANVISKRHRHLKVLVRHEDEHEGDHHPSRSKFNLLDELHRYGYENSDVNHVLTLHPGKAFRHKSIEATPVSLSSRLAGTTDDYPTTTFISCDFPLFSASCIEYLYKSYYFSAFHRTVAKPPVEIESGREPAQESTESASEVSSISICPPKRNVS